MPYDGHFLEHTRTLIWTSCLFHVLCLVLLNAYTVQSYNSKALPDEIAALICFEAA